MSGSSNTHAKKAPSASKRWLNCTASIPATEEHQKAITLGAAAEILDLTPYLKGLPEEELHPDEALAMKLAPQVVSGQIEPTEVQADILQSNSGSIYSREGTRAHDFGEQILNGEIEITDIPEDFQSPVGVYVNECRRLIKENPTMEPLVEEKTPLFYDPTGSGTVDFAVISEDMVTILDLKYGQGVMVAVEDNPQLKIYGASLMEELAADGLYSFHSGSVLRIGVCQPRHHGAAPIRYWDTTWGELQEWMVEVQQVVDNIDDGEAEYVPGEEICRWCPKPVKARCSARQEMLAADWGEDDVRASLDLLDDLTPQPRSKEMKAWKAAPAEEKIRKYEEGMGQLSTEFLVHIWSKRKQWNSFMDDIAEYLSDLAKGGNPADGTKMVLGREGNRAWTDEAVAEKMLENQRFNKDIRTTAKIISVTTAEKLLNEKLTPGSPKYSPKLAKVFEALVTRSAAQPSLAPEDDKRPAISSPIDLLDDLGDDDGGLGEPADIK